MVIRQYSVVLVNLDPTLGHEINKTRPCVVVSPDELNRHLRTKIIAPLTSTDKGYPSRVPVNHNNKKGWIVLDQLRTVSDERISRHLGKLSATEIDALKLTLKELLVD
jgi:mRNA interferase MazF